jgi:hypothetical protein
MNFKIKVEKSMKLLCPKNCPPAGDGNIGFRLVGVPVNLRDDLTIDIEGLHSSIMNAFKGLIPGAKLLCGRCNEKAVMEK